MRNLRTAVVGALAAVVLGSTITAPAEADLLPYVPWTSYLPSWSDEYVPSSANDCVAGRDRCLKATLRELADINDANARSCSHNAPFSLAYLRMTQTYGWAREVPGYYQDVPVQNHLDAVFAKYYIDAFRSWEQGKRAKVPQAWLMAFDAATGRKLSGSGDLLMGMNAHINRDLPFVLASVGLVNADGSSRKPDYDQHEDWLYTASEPMNFESAVRFDPTMDDANDPLGLGYYSVWQMVSSWRENAWRNAEALLAAPTPAARDLVARKIETDANLIATTVKLTMSYKWPLQSSVPRDAFCADNKDTASTMAYDFGVAAPYGY